VYDLWSILNILAILSIGLLAITIPTYAIAVPFIRREVFAVRSEENALKNVISSLRKNGESVAEDIKLYEDRLAQIRRSIEWSQDISATNVVLTPLLLFGISLLAILELISIFS